VARRVRTTLAGHEQRIWALAYAPDGKTLAAAAGAWSPGGDAGSVRLWDPVAGTLRRELAGIKTLCFAVAFAPDGKTLATGGTDNIIRLWDPVTGAQSATLRGHDGAIRCLAFTRDGKTLASASFDGLVKYWDVASRTEKALMPAHGGGCIGLAFSPDGKVLATFGRPNRNHAPGVETLTEVKLWDAPILKERANLRGHRGEVRAVAFAPDGKTVVSAGGDADGPAELKVWDVASGEPRRDVAGRLARALNAVVFSPDGQLLASVGGVEGRPGNVQLSDLRASAGEDAEP
jgi:WD40 repeat protein